MEQLIEKQIRQYDPRIRRLALLQKEMEDRINRVDLATEEKLALFKSAQHRYDKMHRSGMDSSGTVILNPEPARPQEPEAGDARLHANQMELHADAQADEPVKDELQNKEPVEHAPNVYVAPLNVNDFQGKLQPRYHDKAKELINLIGKHSTLISIDRHSREAILDDRKIPRSSIFVLMKSLYEGKLKR